MKAPLADLTGSAAATDREGSPPGQRDGLNLASQLQSAAEQWRGADGGEDSLGTPDLQVGPAVSAPRAGGAGTLPFAKYAAARPHMTLSRSEDCHVLLLVPCRARSA